MHSRGDDVFGDCYSYTGRTLFIGQSWDQCCVVYKAMSDTSMLAGQLARLLCRDFVGRNENEYGACRRRIDTIVTPQLVMLQSGRGGAGDKIAETAD